jgi:hypothetical protein
MTWLSAVILKSRKRQRIVERFEDTQGGLLGSALNDSRKHLPQPSKLPPFQRPVMKSRLHDSIENTLDKSNLILIPRKEVVRILAGFCRRDLISR